MMYKNNNRVTWIISVVLAVVVLIVVVLLVVNVFNNNKKEEDLEVTDAGITALTTINDGSGVRMTVRGRIVADEIHSSYQITVRPTSRVMNVYQGYLNRLIRSKVEINNFEAYTEFAFALSHLGLMNGRELSVDIRGICPDGTLTTFEVLNGNEVVKTLWRTSCSKVTDSFVGRYSTVERLFTDQIVDHKTLLKGIRL